MLLAPPGPLKVLVPSYLTCGFGGGCDGSGTQFSGHLGTIGIAQRSALAASLAWGVWAHNEPDVQLRATRRPGSDELLAAAGTELEI